MIGYMVDLETWGQIQGWAEAYPEIIFPELTEKEWIKAHEALLSVGLSLDRISASNMRHVITRVWTLLDDGQDPSPTTD